jgi:hypothetical protein
LVPRTTVPRRKLIPLRRLRATAALAGALAAVSAIGPAVSQAAHPAAGGYPSSIIVLGHSGATGQNSDPDRPGEEARANSWATGTNPKVDSLYLRIRAKHPAITGHAFNLAQGGATVTELVQQAHEAVALSPVPQLIVVQIMDNDIVCPATAQEYASFLSTFASALGVLAKGAPHSRIFVVSQFGSPGTFAASLSRSERLRFALQSGIGGGPCDFVNPEGRIVDAKVAALDKDIHGYEAELKAGCLRFKQCHYDGGAAGNIADKRSYVSSDLNHFSIAGNAKAAAVAWAAMQRVGVIPRDAP